jgi:hypothetical protein
MTPVIRVDDEVMAELKKRAIDFGLVFEPPNATLRKVLGIDSGNEYILEGKIYNQNPGANSPTWEIGHFKRSSSRLLPFDKYPAVPDTGISLTLVIQNKEYPVRFHHYEKTGGGYIGGDDKSLSLKDILDEHGLAIHNMSVILHFRDDKVYLESQPSRQSGISQSEEGR